MILNRNIVVATEAMAQAGGEDALGVGCLPGWARLWDGGRSWDVLVGLAPLGGFALGVWAASCDGVTFGVGLLVRWSASWHGVAPGVGSLPGWARFWECCSYWFTFAN